MPPRRLTIPEVRLRSLNAQGVGGLLPTIEAAVVAAAGIHGSAPTSHFSLAARVAAYSQDALERSLVVDRSIVRVPAMRTSVYLLPTELAMHGVALVGARTFAWIQKALEMSDADYRRAAERIEALLEETPRTAADIRRALGDAAPEGQRLTLLLRQMSNEGRILKTATRGGIRSQRFEYAVTRGWIEVPNPLPRFAEALAVLTELWLEAHGPGTVSDLAWWAGVRHEDAAGALAASDAVQLEVDGLEGELFAAESSLGPRHEVQSGVQLLPVWDAYLMAHRDRTRYLSGAHRPFVVDPSGNVTNVVVRNGEVVGVWDLDGTTLRFGQLPGARVAAADVAAAASAFAGLVDVTELEEVDPQPLAGRGQNRFQAPLRDLT